MRFRAKFGLIDSLWLAVGATYLLILVSRAGHLRPSFIFCAIAFLPQALLRLLGLIFVYWEIDSDGLHERRLWRMRSIPWAEVASVTFWPDEQKVSSSFAIRYERPAPLSDRGSIIANPSDRDTFLQELQRHAPGASFDVPIRLSVIPQS
jgi:hypothetical protein